MIWLIALVGLVGLSGNVDATEQYVIAKVDDVEITGFELQRETQRIMPFNKSFHGSISKDRLKVIQKMALDRLIDQAYKVRYAQIHEITIPDSQIDERVDAVKAKFGDKKGLKKALGNEGLKEFRKSVYRLLVAKKAEEVAVNSKAEVGDEELLTFYRQNTYMYQRPMQYRASHILIKVDPSLVGEEREKLLAKANDLAAKAKSGENFYNLAYYNSDEDTKFVGGDIGYFHSGQTVKAFEDAIKDLDPGDIVGPVETISGFHVIQLTEIQDARLLDFDEVKAKIKQTIEDKKRTQLYDGWLKELKSQVPAEIIYIDLKS